MKEVVIDILKNTMKEQENILYYEIYPKFSTCLCCCYGPHHYQKIPDFCARCSKHNDRKHPKVVAIPIWREGTPLEILNSRQNNFCYDISVDAKDYYDFRYGEEYVCKR